MKAQHIKTLFCLLLMFSPMLVGVLFAQPGFTDDVDDVPVDGGLSLLIAAGAGYGARKLKRRKP
jgi:hypothetical protein